MYCLDHGQMTIKRTGQLFFIRLSKYMVKIHMGVSVLFQCRCVSSLRISSMIDSCHLNT